MDIKTELELGARILIWSGAAYAGCRLIEAGVKSGLSFFAQNTRSNLDSQLRLQTQELSDVVNELEEVVAEGESIVVFGQENILKWERLLDQEEFARKTSYEFKY